MHFHSPKDAMNAGIAMVQKDFKYVIGFSSVSHMGLRLVDRLVDLEISGGQEADPR
jgi:NADH:ubiquinone oxidoreductase subunit 4 (subunit M)